MRRRWLKIGVVVSALVVVPLGVRFLIAPIFIDHPDSLHIVVTQERDYPTLQKSVIFDHQFSAQATPVYSELVAGKRLDSNDVYSCPIVNQQIWYHYELTFSRWGVMTATATSDARDCGFISVKYPLGVTEGYSWYRGENNPTFWASLYELTNAPQPSGF
ncbi:MAG TPA: hypothetical protein VFX24_05095 [Ktedonobacterales bacterium]|jgi:hypothetical protein|nr:hypothetical protein [Ktedonobacterales bacterium]